MISLVLIVLASICNAIMDVCAFHYHQSIFKNRNPKYWNAEVSWKAKYVDWDGGNKNRTKFFFGLINIPVQLTDSWHCAKASMIFFLISAVVFFQPITPDMHPIVSIAILGTCWNGSFSIFYNRVLR